MESRQNANLSEEEEAFLRGMGISGGLVHNMVLKAACELDLFDLIANAGGGVPDALFSAAEIASLLPIQSPQGAAMLDRMLRFLASFSYFNCQVITDENGHYPKRLYSLGPSSKILINSGKDGGQYCSLAPLLLLTLDKVMIDAWCHLKDAILGGGGGGGGGGGEGAPFVLAHGMNAFEYPSKDSRFNEVFNKAMVGPTSMVIKRLLEVYDGFDGITELVDVGGGFGATAGAIVSKYPNIQAINFDLPHVIHNAPPMKGVVHVAGDMFESIPRGQVILLKCVLHDWSDDHCMKILSNCFKKLPENSKLIVVDTILPESPDASLLSSVGLQYDIAMMVVNPGGMERTSQEFEILAKKSGFTSIKLICRAYNYWVIEFYKK